MQVISGTINLRVFNEIESRWVTTQVSPGDGQGGVIEVARDLHTRLPALTARTINFEARFDFPTNFLPTKEHITKNPLRLLITTPTTLHISPVPVPSTPIHRIKPPSSATMAEVAKPSTTPVDETAKTKTHVEKPEKPNEEEYRTALAKLEKEHKTKQDAYVSSPTPHSNS